MRIALLTLLVTLAVALLSQSNVAPIKATATRSPNFAEADVTFQNDMKPIFTRYCAGCHAGILTYEVAYKQREKIYDKFVRNAKMPPKYAEQPTQAEVNLVKKWIDQGAKK